MRCRFDFIAAAFTTLSVLAAAASEGTVPRPEYPRPQFERSEWVNLNGDGWTVELDLGASGEQPGRELFKSSGFSRRIVVPFCVESDLSGVGYRDFVPQVWYHRRLEVPDKWSGQRILLNFGAVDFACVVYLDGKAVGEHSGGFSSFTIDLTPYVRTGAGHNLVVMVRNNPVGGEQPRGKQCDKYASYGCLYTRVTGIWQTVWMEAVDAAALRRCAIVPDFDNSSFAFVPEFYSAPRGGFRVAVKDADGRIVAQKSVHAADGVTVVLAIPEPRAWSPEDPHLYDVLFEVTDESGRVVDSVKSYAGLRKFHCAGGRFWLNNRPCYLRFALDQGYYPDGIWTAPTDEALRRDIELALSAGFNGARLHQKVFEERFHYWADRLGYLTVGETGSWGATEGSSLGARNILSEWAETVRRDRNHPSIVMWAPANETHFRASRGDAAAYAVERLLGELYELTKAIDPTRPVNTSSGGIWYKTDAWSVHFAYCAREPQFKQLDKFDSTTIHNGKAFADKYLKFVHFDTYRGQPWWIDEFGGYWFPTPNSPTPPSDAFPADAEGRMADYETQIDYFLSLPHCAGWCIVQLYDVEQEQNGIYDYWRRPKMDIARVRRIFSKDKYKGAK